MNQRPSTPTALRLLLSLLLLAGIVQAVPSRAAPLRAPSVPPAAVSIAGPGEGGASSAYTFTATVTPPDTTLPLTYAWPASPITGTELLLPGAQRRLQLDGTVDWSELVVQNAGQVTATVEVAFLNPSGTVAHTLRQA